MHMPSTKLGMMLLAAVLTTVLGLVFAGVVVSMATTSGEQFMQLCEVASRGLNDLVPLLYVAGLLITVGAIFYGIGRGLKTGMAAVALAVTVGAGLFAVQPPQTASAAPSCIYVDGSTNMNDDALLRYGTDGDVATVLRSTILAADAEVANLIVGTSNHPGVAANSYILSNVTQDGDVMVLVNNGGNSIATELVDASAGQTELNPAQADWNLVVKTLNNAQTLAVDGATDSVRIGGNNIADTGSLLVYAKSSIGSSGSPSHSWWTSSTTTIPEAGAYAITYGAYFGQTTWAGVAGGAAESITDAATVYILGAPIQGSDITVTTTWALLVEAGVSGFGGNIVPQANDGSAVGTTALGWSDLHLATGGVINWANGEVTITETDANTLTLAGGNLVLPDNGIIYFGTGSDASLTYTGTNLVLDFPQATTAFVINEAAADVDFRVESDTTANHYVSDAGQFSGVGSHAFGAAAANFAYLLADQPALTATAGTEFHRVYVRNTNTVTIPTGAATYVTSLNIDEPNITLVGTATNAATVRIGTAPTEGGTLNAALWVDSGLVVFDDQLGVGIGGSGAYAAQPAGSIGVAGGVMLGASSTNNLIDDASNGAASTTLYIGNAAITVASDQRLKYNITPYTQDALALLKRLSVVEYDQDLYRPFGDIKHYVGFTAQNIHEVAPYAVNTQGDTGLPWQVNYNLMTGLIVKSVQQLDSRTLALEAENATLKSRLDALEARVNAALN